jgi:hypothetical protein
MSSTISPNILSEGLVFAIDVANEKSYVTGSSNLINLAHSKYNGVISANTTSSFVLAPCLDFNGTSDRVFFNLGTNTDIRLYNCTIFCTFRKTSTTNGQKCVFSYRGGSGGPMYIGTQNQTLFTYYNGTSIQSLSGIAPTPTNTLVFTTIVISTDTIYHFINGALKGDSGILTGISTDYNNTLYLGYDAGGTDEYFQGQIYNFMHYNRILSSKEIFEVFESLRTRFDL